MAENCCPMAHSATLKIFSFILAVSYQPSATSSQLRWAVADG
jgi:hypothetical protein